MKLAIVIIGVVVIVGAIVLVSKYAPKKPGAAEEASGQSAPPSSGLLGMTGESGNDYFYKRGKGQTPTAVVSSSPIPPPGSSYDPWMAPSSAHVSVLGGTNVIRG